MLRNNSSTYRQEAIGARRLSPMMGTAETSALLSDYADQCDARAVLIDAQEIVSTAPTGEVR